jgi:ribonuclease Z
MATDLMVWNVTKDEITERMAEATEEAWAVPGTAVQPPPQRGLPNPISEWIDGGRWDVSDAQDAMLDAHMEKYGLQDQDWRKKEK